MIPLNVAHSNAAEGSAGQVRRALGEGVKRKWWIAAPAAQLCRGVWVEVKATAQTEAVHVAEPVILNGMAELSACSVTCCSAG